jgi:hypothetical protein
MTPAQLEDVERRGGCVADMKVWWFARQNRMPARGVI